MSSTAAAAAGTPLSPPSCVKAGLPSLLRCTPEEQAAIDSLRARLGDVESLIPCSSVGDRWRSDAMLLRFLRARKFDVNAAEAMFREVVRWRNEIGANTIIDDYKEPDVMRYYYPGGIHGVDREGNAVLYERLGVM